MGMTLMVMKGNWVKLLGYGRPRTVAWQLVYRLSWGTVALEMFLCILLTIVEAIGTLMVLPKHRWHEACEMESKLPVNAWQSYVHGEWTDYTSFFDFCNMWLTLNLIMNFGSLVLYYIYIGYR